MLMQRRNRLTSSRQRETESLELTQLPPSLFKAELGTTALSLEKVLCSRVPQ